MARAPHRGPSNRSRARRRPAKSGGPTGLFSGKVVWITGAGTAIGRAGALMFAGEGATVALLGRRRGPLDEVAAEIAAGGGRGIAVPLDVADRAEVDRVARELIAQHKRVD